MIRGVGRVILFARDLRPMIGFYRDVLGMVPVASEHSPDEWQAFDTGGDCEFALHGVAAEYRDQILLGDPPDARHATPAKFVLRVDDAAKARDALRDKGVRFVGPEPAADAPVVRFDILDPEGNIVQISQE